MTTTTTIKWDGELRRVPLRDSQRQRAYNAERAAFSGMLYARETPDAFQTFQDVLRYVRRIERSATWEKMLALTDRRRVGTLDVRQGKSNWRATGSRWELVLPQWAWTVPIVLHEMAHAAVPGARHNWPWAQVYLRLVRRFIGVEAHARLKSAFDEHGVKYRVGSKPKPVVVQFESRLEDFFRRS